MRLVLLVALTMTAFAANSVLNRAALVSGATDPVSFGVLRLVFGALALGALAWMRGARVDWRGARRGIGVVSLIVYIFGFSLAYVALDAGLGALILFGTVQVTMFVGALSGGEAVPRRRWAGAALAFAGLAWLLWPSAGGTLSPWRGALMALAGIGWGVYSLAGRREADALGGTAANFALAGAVALIGWAVASPVMASRIDGTGLILAALSGAVTSGLGYALWYTVLPRLAASVAAVAQLTVPLIAMAGGIVLLGEPLTPRFVVAAVLIAAGVTLSAVRVSGGSAPAGRAAPRR